MCSDIIASLMRVPFECRKQLVQMCNYDVDLKLLGRNTYLGAIPLVGRDVLFRQIIFSIYYGTTEIEHRPTLKYTIPQITDFMRQRREQGYEGETLQDLQHVFYEYHNYNIRSSYTMRLTVLIFANLVATLVTNPIDVCLSKILT